MYCRYLIDLPMTQRYTVPVIICDSSGAVRYIFAFIGTIPFSGRTWFPCCASMFLPTGCRTGYCFSCLSPCLPPCPFPTLPVFQTASSLSCLFSRQPASFPSFLPDCLSPVLFVLQTACLLSFLHSRLPVSCPACFPDCLSPFLPFFQTACLLSCLSFRLPVFHSPHSPSLTLPVFQTA